MKGGVNIGWDGDRSRQKADDLVRGSRRRRRLDLPGGSFLCPFVAGQGKITLVIAGAILALWFKALVAFLQPTEPQLEKPLLSPLDVGHLTDHRHEDRLASGHRRADRLKAQLLVEGDPVLHTG